MFRSRLVLGSVLVSVLACANSPTVPSASSGYTAPDVPNAQSIVGIVEMFGEPQRLALRQRHRVVLLIADEEMGLQSKVGQELALVGHFTPDGEFSVRSYGGVDRGEEFEYITAAQKKRIEMH